MRPALRQTLRAARFADAAPLLEARDLIKPELVWQIEAGLRQTGAEVSTRHGSCHNCHQGHAAKWLSWMPRLRPHAHYKRGHVVRAA